MTLRQQRGVDLFFLGVTASMACLCGAGAVDPRAAVIPAEVTAHAQLVWEQDAIMVLASSVIFKFC